MPNLRICDTRKKNPGENTEPEVEKTDGHNLVLSKQKSDILESFWHAL